MGYQGFHIVLPTRFLVTIGYFIVTILAFYHKELNVTAGIRSNASESEFNDAEDSFLAAWGLSIVAFVITLGGLLTGATMMFQKVRRVSSESLIQIVVSLLSSCRLIYCILCSIFWGPYSLHFSSLMNGTIERTGKRATCRP